MKAFAFVAAKAVFGATMALGFATMPAHAKAPLEDEPGWSCVDSGNHVCGPLSDDWGHAPGCYDDGGVLEFEWPCSPWTPDEGYVHGDGTVTYPNGDVYCPSDGEIYASAEDCDNHDLRQAPQGV